jgi:hypothetical protein
LHVRVIVGRRYEPVHDRCAVRDFRAGLFGGRGKRHCRRARSGQVRPAHHHRPGHHRRQRLAAITAPASGSPGDPGVGIQIYAGASDNVILIGITVDGVNSDFNTGIEMFSGGSLIVIGCTVRNTSQNAGLTFVNNGFSPAMLTVEDSHFLNNGLANDGFGILVHSSGPITASLVRTEFTGNPNGLGVFTYGSAAVSAAVTDSVAANNSAAGFLVGSYDGGVVNLSLTNDQIVDNGYGIQVFTGSAVVWLAQSVVAGNGTAGFQVTSGGVLNSYSNNYFANNGSNTGSLTLVGTQ